MMRKPKGAWVELSEVVVRVASFLVPRQRRSRWLREWRAELWHEARHRDPAGGPDNGRGTLFRSSLGAIPDAWTLRREVNVRPEPSTGFGQTGEVMTMLGRDLRIAGRSLARTPAFSLIALATLALGIGASVAIFALVDRVVLAPLPYPESQRLVRIMNMVPGVSPDTEWQLSTAQFVYYDEAATTLDGIGLYTRGGGNVETASGPTRASVTRISASMVTLLGASAHDGRLIGTADDQPGRPLVMVLSHGFWTREFGGDPGVLGSSFTVGGVPVEIVGVMNPGIDLPGVVPGGGTDIWMPLQVDRGGPFQNNHVFPAIARRAPGTELGAVTRELRELSTDLPDLFPNVYAQAFFDRYGFRPVAYDLKDYVVGDTGRSLWILLAAVAGVLLIACANVVNLFLVRMENRRQELAVRRALGAGRGTLARLLLAETLTVSAAATALGAVLAHWSLRALVAASPSALPRVGEAQLTPASLFVAGGLALAVGLALGVLPVGLRKPRPLAMTLSRTRGGAGVQRSRQHLRDGLVVAQVAIALTLVIGAGLLLASATKLRAVDPGLDPEGVAVLEVYPSRDRHPDPQQGWQFFGQLLEEVRAMPGVQSAGAATNVPLEGGYGCTVQGFEDRTVYDRLKEAGLTTCAGQIPVTSGYFEALGIPILEGRGITDADLNAPDRGVVVVSQAFADRFWPGEDPIGKGVAPSGRSQGPFYRVVGVAGDIKAERLTDGAAVAVYYPMVPIPETYMPWWGAMNVVVRVGTDAPLNLVPAIRQAVRGHDPSAPVVNVRAMEDVVDASMGQVAFFTLLLEVAAGAALLLAAVGLYGVVSYSVSRRTREIGTRIALGARAATVEWMVVRGALVLAGLGVLAGLATALAASTVLEGLLYGVEPADPLVFLVASAGLTAITLFAAWLPARRAARIDPTRALAAE